MSESASIKRVSAWHEELMDFMLAQPRAGLKETSEYFGVTMSWLSTVKNSDAFQDEWNRRRGLHSSAVSVTIVQRVEALAEVALETMTQKLEKEGAAIGLTTLREVSETALKSLGFGNRDNLRAGAAQHIGVQNNMIVVDRESLARAREARARMQLGATQIPSLESPADVLGGPSAEDSALGSEGSEGESGHDDSPSTSTRDVVVIDNIPPRTPGNLHQKDKGE